MTAPAATAVDLDALIAARPPSRPPMRPGPSWLRPLGAEGGARPTRRRGRGLERADLRNYVPGDDPRDIDWRASARTGRVHVATRREERDRLVMLVVDLRECMRFGAHTRFRSVAACEVAALVAWSAAEAGDRVGGLVVTDDGARRITPRAGRRGPLGFLAALAESDGAARAGPAPRGAPETLTALMAPHVRALSRAQEVVVFSALDAPGDGFATLVGGLASGERGPGAEVTVARVGDALSSAAPPAGAYAFHDAARRFSAVVLTDPARETVTRRLTAAQAEAARAINATGGLVVEIDAAAPVLDGWRAVMAARG